VPRDGHGGHVSVRVALVEDHAATRAEIARTLADHADRLQLVATFADAPSFLAYPGLAQVEVALVDLRLPNMSGCEAISALAKRAPRVRALALTVLDDEDTVFEAMRVGAYGYLLKDDSPTRLAAAIEDVARRAHPLSSRVAGFLVARTRRSPPNGLLTHREEEVARALADGASYAECAARLGITVSTVQAYVKLVYRKLDVSSKKELRELLATRSPRDP